MVLLLAAAAPAASAQAAGAGASERPACGLKAAEAPDVLGLRLGLTPAHIYELFPGSADDQDVRAALAASGGRFGMASFSPKPETYAKNTAYAGVTSVSLRFFDGRLAGFTVSSEGPEWPGVDDFVAKFVEGTALPPPGAWEAHAGLDTQLKNLVCQDFSISLFAGGRNVKLNYVRVTDTEAERLWKERREKARAAEPAAKP